MIAYTIDVKNIVDDFVKINLPYRGRALDKLGEIVARREKWISRKEGNFCTQGQEREGKIRKCVPYYFCLGKEGSST